MEDKLGEKVGDKASKASGRRTHHPTKGKKLRQAKRKERQGLGKADAPSNNGKQKTRRAGRQAGGQDGRQAGRQGRRGFGKADTPSNEGEGGRTIQGETRRETSWESSWATRPREGGHHPRKENKLGDSWETSWETRGYNGRQGLGKRTHHPTQARMWGDNKRQAGGQGETSPREGGHTC